MVELFPLVTQTCNPTVSRAVGPLSPFPASGIGVAVGVAPTGMLVGVAVGAGVGTGVSVDVGTGVSVDVGTGVLVGVLVDGSGVLVAVGGSGVFVGGIGALVAVDVEVGS